MKFIKKIILKKLNIFGILNRYWHFWALQPDPNLNPLATFIVYFNEPKNYIFLKIHVH